MISLTTISYLLRFQSRLKLLNTEEDEDDLMVLKRKNYDPDEELVKPILICD